MHRPKIHSLWRLCLPLLLSGCFLVPSKETDCSDKRPCGSGQVCDPARAVCVPDTSQDLLAPEDLSVPEDLTVEEDLAVPDLAMPDLRPECVNEGECPAGMGLSCNLGTKKCAACQTNADCESLICDPYQSTTFGGATSRGRCVSRAEVVYVDNKNGGACTSMDGTEAPKPLCTLQEGVDKLDATKKWVRVAASTTAYERITVVGKSGTIYGPDGVGGKVQIGNNMAMIGVTVSGAADISLFGVEVLKGNPGISCSGPGPKLKLRRTTVTQTMGAGLVANNCALEIDRSFFSGNLDGAVFATAAANYVITNSFFVQNGRAMGPTALRFEGTCSGTFRFNTVAGNSANIQGGIACNANVLEIRDSIVVANNIFGGSQFLGNCSLVKTVVGPGDNFPAGLTMTPDFESTMTQDYRLKNLVANETCCVDKASNGASTTTPIDHFGKARPDCTTNKCDIGAHELKDL